MKVFWALNRATSRRSGKRRDVPESSENQRRDVGISRRDVPESVKINVATLEINVATFQRSSKSNVAMFQRGVKMTSRRCDVATFKCHDVESQRRDVTEKAQNEQKFNKGLR